MEYALLALDMDGTVLHSDSVTVTGRTLDAIRAAISRGIVVAYCTGRMRNRLPEALQAVPEMHYAVTSNGGAVVDLATGELLYSNALPKEKALELIATLSRYPVPIDVYCDGDNYCNPLTRERILHNPLPESRRRSMLRGRYVVEDLPAFLRGTGKQIEKINLAYIPPEVRGEIRDFLAGVGGICVTSSFSENAEINAATANKGDGLSHLCDRLGIPPQRVMAVGDGPNDEQMMRYAGLPVAPANAVAKIKALAKVIAPSNDEDGVAWAIERCLLGADQ